MMRWNREKPITWHKPTADPASEPAVTSNPYCRSCLEHATNAGPCHGAGGEGRPSYQQPTCWTGIASTPASTGDDGCLHHDVLDLDTFMLRVAAITQQPHDQAVELIGRETVLEVLTQARDICPGDRLLAINRRIRELCRKRQAVPA